MGFLDRMSRLMKSSVNSAIDQVSDPAKEVEQLILDMEAERREAYAETQRLMATEKQARARAQDLERKVATWGEHAEEAVHSSNDTLAREALEAQAQASEDLAQARQEEAEAGRMASEYRTALQALEGHLQEVKLRKGTVKAKIAANTTEELRTETLEAFDRMAGKVDNIENVSAALAELAGETEEASRPALPVKQDDSDVEARLAALKRKLDA